MFSLPELLTRITHHMILEDEIVRIALIIEQLYCPRIPTAKEQTILSA